MYESSPWNLDPIKDTVYVDLVRQYERASRSCGYALIKIAEITAACISFLSRYERRCLDYSR